MTVPLPQARPKAVDLAYARPRAVESIAIDVSATSVGYRCIAVGESWSWSTILAVPNPDVAVLDVISKIVAGDHAGRRIRFVPNLPGRSPLWRHAGQIISDSGDWWIERPDRRDSALIAAAMDLRSAASTAPQPVSPGAPVTVATDGSVRGKHAGFAWLASSGDYGLAGYRSSSQTVGTDETLVAELCAIGDAVSQLPGRHLTVLCDSQNAVTMARRWIRGDSVLPAGYADAEDVALEVFRHRIFAERSRLEIGWVRGHSGHPLNEGADALARLASRKQRGDCDVSGDEYGRRALGIARAFAAEFRRSGALTG